MSLERWTATNTESTPLSEELLRDAYEEMSYSPEDVEPLRHPKESIAEGRCPRCEDSTLDRDQATTVGALVRGEECWFTVVKCPECRWWFGARDSEFFATPNWWIKRFRASLASRSREGQ